MEFIRSQSGSSRLSGSVYTPRPEAVFWRLDWPSLKVSGSHGRTFFSESANFNQSTDVHEGKTLMEEAVSNDQPEFLLIRENEESAKYVGVSMLHQLHCVAHVRLALDAVRSGEIARAGQIHDSGGSAH